MAIFTFSYVPAGPPRPHCPRTTDLPDPAPCPYGPAPLPLPPVPCPSPCPPPTCRAGPGLCPRAAVPPVAVLAVAPAGLARAHAAEARDGQRIGTSESVCYGQGHLVPASLPWRQVHQSDLHVPTPLRRETGGGRRGEGRVLLHWHSCIQCSPMQAHMGQLAAHPSDPCLPPAAHLQLR